MSIKPTINNNGTNGKELLQQQLDAHAAVREAIAVLCKAAPHGRDYQTNGNDDAYREARATWEQLNDMLITVRDEVFATGIHIRDQLDR